MAGQFVVTRNGRDSFCTAEELRDLAATGRLSAGDLVYHPVLGRWLYAREVEEVRRELGEAVQLGRPQAPLAPVASNGEAIAGFILGILGHLPIVGLVCCLLGIFFSSRGLKRAAMIESHRGHGLAVAGLVLSIIFLIPATACGALMLGGMLSPLW